VRKFAPHFYFPGGLLAKWPVDWRIAGRSVVWGGGWGAVCRGLAPVMFCRRWLRCCPVVPGGVLPGGCSGV